MGFELDPLCELCAATIFGGGVRRRCSGCDRLHDICLWCEQGYGLVVENGLGRFAVCPDAIKVANAVMREER